MRRPFQKRKGASGRWGKNPHGMKSTPSRFARDCKVRWVLFFVVCWFVPSPPPCKLEQKAPKRAGPGRRLEAASGMNLVIKTPGPQAQLLSVCIAVWVEEERDSPAQRRVGHRFRRGEEGPGVGEGPSFWDRASPKWPPSGGRPARPAARAALGR